MTGIAVGGGGAMIIAKRSEEASRADENVASSSNAGATVKIDAGLGGPPPPDAQTTLGAPVPTSADAAVLVVDATPVDSQPTEPAPVDAGKEPSRRTEKPTRSTQAPSEPGTLRVEVDPWAQVSISGQRETFTTPVTLNLPPGHYRVVLTKGEQKETVNVTITSNQTSRINRTW